MSFLSGLYGVGVGSRNYLYDRHFLRARKLRAPVVSVGNISVGGSGKTPFVICLGELLKQRGIAFDVLSRGYRRRTKGVLVVDAGGTARDFGDEPLLIAKRLGCPVVVGSSRYQAGLLAEEKFASQLHILDDGFQHRSLARELDIVLVDSADLGDQLLPTGRLRELPGALARASVAVINDETAGSAMPPGVQIWRVKRGLRINEVPVKPIVFCGIAKPKKLFEQLERKGIRAVAQRVYPDHYVYSDSDVAQLVRLREANGAGGFITTEKDAINLAADLEKLGKVCIAQVTMEFVAPADPLDTILRLIPDRVPRT